MERVLHLPAHEVQDQGVGGGLQKADEFLHPCPHRRPAVMGTADGLWISSSVSMGPLDLCQLMGPLDRGWGLWISVSSVSMGPLDLCQLGEYGASGSLSAR